MFSNFLHNFRIEEVISEENKSSSKWYHDAEFKKKDKTLVLPAPQELW